MRVKTGNGWPHDVTRADLELSFYKGSGAGGQKKNKTSSGVRIKHIPTGLVAQCDEHREQTKNKTTAFRKLCDLLLPLMKAERIKERYSSGTERVRTYHEPDRRVVDHRSGAQADYETVLNGEIDRLLT